MERCVAELKAYCSDVMGLDVRDDRAEGMVRAVLNAGRLSECPAAIKRLRIRLAMHVDVQEVPTEGWAVDTLRDVEDAAMGKGKS